ncbi:MAG: ribokinase [Cyanobacteria bacterium]|nr:ribokinase [Cyanobacteriota bacterium]
MMPMGTPRSPDAMPPNRMRPQVVMLGSLNADLMVRVPRLPVAGETLTGHTWTTGPGGKGANQAIAAARLGSAVAAVGRVGDDDFGRMLRDTLAAAQVDASQVVTDPHTPTGMALVTVATGGDRQGENQIVLLPGANGQVGAAEVARLQTLLRPGLIVLLQLEVPIAAVVAAAEQARQSGAIAIVDPAPVPDAFPEELYALATVLTPNETEASRLVGFPVRDRATATAAARILRDRGAETVVITLGDRGALALTPNELLWQSPFAVAAIDTVAAGDAFNGALATAIAEGQPWPAALRFAAAAGALCTTTAGAADALPHRAAVDQLLTTAQAPTELTAFP